MRTLKQNKKGVSPIIATLLLIVIAVAAAVVTYAFVSGFIGTATATSKQTGSMSVDSYTINATGTAVTAYVRNTGTTTLTLTASGVYVDGQVATMTGAGTVAPGAVLTLVVTSPGPNLANGVSHQLRIVAADGTPVSIGIVK